MSRYEVPVLLLTGYLGSGKTTLLNRILNNEKGIKFAVIVNDIGEVNIDADLIEKGGVVDKQDDSLVALQNGCICCTLKMDLVQQLNDIVKLQKFDYIVIEASGICEPAPIAQTIYSIPSMGDQFCQGGIPRLDCIVTVVDALRMKDEFGCGKSLLGAQRDEEDIENLVIQQIEFCNIILLNKASEVTPDELKRVTEIVRAIQPKAEIIPCDYGDVDFDKILHTGLFDFDRTATSATWIQEVEDASHHHHHDEDDDDDEDEHEHEHEHHHHDHDHEGHDHLAEFGIDTYIYYARAPFELGRFDEFVATQWPKNVIRCKGMCYFSEEYDMCYLFEQAGRQFNLRKAGEWFATMPKEELEQLMADDAQLRKDWDEHYGDRMQKLVFIGQHLDKKALKAALDNCLQ